jgi:hypothetical protein
MPTMPVPTNTDIAVQNNATGQVDYLQFQGSTLVRSAAFTYASAGWNVVAQGNFGGGTPGLVLQNQTSGFLDFLMLDANGNLVGSAMSNVAVPRIVGQGRFTTIPPGEAGPTFVSQLANGQLDMLAFNASGQLIHSDLIGNSVGFASAIGVAETPTEGAAFANVAPGNNNSVLLQLPDGSIDSIGFSGDFASGTLSASASLMLPGSAGSAPVQAIDQEAGVNSNGNISGGTGTGGRTLEGVQFVEQLSNGALDSVYADSGYGDAAHEGTLYASTLLNLSLPGWHAVDAGAIARELFPIT